MSGGTAAPQVRNTEQVDILSTDFVRRNEATLAWGKAISMFQMLAGLRGFWPMSSNDSAGTAFDLSGQGRSLSYNGNPTYGYTGLAPWIWFDGTGDYLSRADEAGLQIVGTETVINSPYRGLTLGGWFYPAAVGNSGLIAKDDGVNRCYTLYNSAGPNLTLSIFNGGGATSVSHPTATVVNTWYFVVGRFDPSTELAIFVNGTKTTNVVAIPASIDTNAAPLTIGDYGGNRMTGAASLCFLTATYLSDGIIQALYHHTRSLFGIV